MTVVHIGDLWLALTQYFVNRKEDMAQNDGPTLIHSTSTFMDMLRRK